MIRKGYITTRPRNRRGKLIAGKMAAAAARKQGT
jgi:hypothetical protein